MMVNIFYEYVEIEKLVNFIILNNANGARNFKLSFTDVNNYKKETFTLIEGDLSDNQVVIETFDKYKPSIVIHLAALSNDPLGELSPNLTSEINYKATINIAELSKKLEESI